MQGTQLQSLVKELDPIYPRVPMPQPKIPCAATKTQHSKINNTYFFLNDELSVDGQMVGRDPLRVYSKECGAFLGGLLVPWKTGSSIPVRAVSGPSVTTLLHSYTHTPIPELTDGSFLWLPVKFPQEWRAPDLAIPRDNWRRWYSAARGRS